MRKNNAHKCPEGNTETSGRVRWYPNFTSFCDEKPVFVKAKMRYLCFGSEICPDTKKHHWQGCVYFKDKVSIKTAQSLLKIESSHMEYIPKSEDPEDAINYCKKEGKFEEYGEFPKQGKRTDLIELRDQLVDNQTSIDDIIMSNPIMYHQYGRTLDKIEDIVLRKKYRTEMTKGIWYHGGTGVGKSHRAFEGYATETHYNLINDNGWWDGYRQQKVIIINDFRGWLSYNELLQMVDKWPYSVKRRGREPMPFLSELVIITSSLPPEAVFHNRNDQDKIEQLLRRFEVIEL